VKPIVVAGAGGHARSVIEALRAAGEYDPVACTDPRPELSGSRLDGVEVVGSDDELRRLLDDGVGAAALGVGGAGDNDPRARLFASLVDLGFELPPVVHPAATIASSAELRSGCAVLAGAVIGAGAVVGDGAIVNNGAIVDHDCLLAAHVHVATAAALSGGVVVGESAHIGTGASVKHGLTIGAGAVVGVGAVVVGDVEAEATVVGSPAVAIRRR
jgi:UDP-perosamine 4-acetyltransferase